MRRASQNTEESDEPIGPPDHRCSRTAGPDPPGIRTEFPVRGVRPPLPRHLGNQPGSRDGYAGPNGGASCLYNQQFRYPVEQLDAPLRVRVFATRSRYDAYMRRLVNETRDGFVYLHYDDLAKSELVGYFVDDESLDRSLIHQSFIQFSAPSFPIRRSGCGKALRSTSKRCTTTRSSVPRSIEKTSRGSIH
jgi:hypothetical protein